jgi:hypothetical protein
MKDAHATDSDIHYGDGGGRGELSAHLPERTSLPMASKKTQEEKEKVRAREACVHLYVLWWRGSCMGCRKEPLSRGLPDHPDHHHRAKKK